MSTDKDYQTIADIATAIDRAEREAVLSEDGLRAGARGIDATAWSFDGTLGWSRRAPFRGHLRFGDLGAAWQGSLPQPLALTLAGEVRAEGDLVEPAGMRLDGTLERLKVRIGARDVATVAVLPLRLARGKIELGPAGLQGPAPSPPPRVPERRPWVGDGT